MRKSPCISQVALSKYIHLIRTYDEALGDRLFVEVPCKPGLFTTERHYTEDTRRLRYSNHRRNIEKKISMPRLSVPLPSLPWRRPQFQVQQLDRYTLLAATAHCLGQCRLLRPRHRHMPLGPCWARPRGTRWRYYGPDIRFVFLYPLPHGTLENTHTLAGRYPPRGPFSPLAPRRPAPSPKPSPGTSALLDSILLPDLTYTDCHFEALLDFAAVMAIAKNRIPQHM